MRLIRRVAIATFKPKMGYRYFIRLAKTNKTSWTNLIHEFNSF